jgi:hypothetical protein
MATNLNKASGWSGWIGFASFLLLFNGLFNVIEGIADLGRHIFFTQESGNVWILNYNKWGWINIIAGIVIISAAVSLAHGDLWGRFFASVVIVLSMLSAVAALPIYPLWSIVVLVVDALILYAIMVQGTKKTS